MDNFPLHFLNHQSPSCFLFSFIFVFLFPSSFFRCSTAINNIMKRVSPCSYFCQDHSDSGLQLSIMRPFLNLLQVQWVQGIFPSQEPSHRRLLPVVHVCLCLCWALSQKASFIQLQREQLLFSYLSLDKTVHYANFELSRIVRPPRVMGGRGEWGAQLLEADQRVEDMFSNMFNIWKCPLSYVKAGTYVAFPLLRLEKKGGSACVIKIEPQKRLKRRF